MQKEKHSATAAVVAGGGRYSLTDSLYTEALEYCSNWPYEAHSFTFTIFIKDDTLIQRGIEKIEETGVSLLNIEKYIRIKD